MNAALVIFAKAPVPGQVKTRLCPPLTPDEAASLHGSLVLDAVERSRAATKMDRFVACAPAADHVFFKILEERYDVRLLDQVGEDLGARMRRVFDILFARGYRRIVLAGTDVPRLPAATYGQARDLLGSHEVVLGPAVDGGYYLIGLSRPAPDLFAGIPWSTDQVLALTQEKAQALALATALLPTYRDLDTIEDLRALLRECGLDRKGTSGKRAAGVPDLSKRTAGVLRLLAERLPARTGQPDG